MVLRAYVDESFEESPDKGVYVLAAVVVSPSTVESVRVMAAELHGAGVEHLIVESRTRTLDGRDVQTVLGVRYGLPRGTRLRIDHRTGPAEPLLWAADVVAGAVRAAYEGDPTYRHLLDDRLYEIGIDILP